LEHLWAGGGPACVTGPDVSSLSPDSFSSGSSRKVSYCEPLRRRSLYLWYSLKRLAAAPFELLCNDVGEMFIVLFIIES